MKKLYTLTCIFFSALLLFLSPDLQGQDPFFAQYYASPLQVNPAMTGVYNGKFRAVVNYREQWSSVIDNPFRTIGTSFDLRQRVGRGDYWALGAVALRDQAGISRYTRTQGLVSAAFMKQLSGGRYTSTEQFLVAGAQAGLGQHSIDFSDLWFSNQFDPTTEDLNLALATGEQINQTSNAYFDFNAGLLWYAVFDENASFYLGGALHHLNGPRVAFLENGGEEIYMRWTGQIGGEFPMNDQLSILPSILVMGQGPSLISLVGTNFRYNNRDWREVALRAGVWAQASNQFESSLGVPSVIVAAFLETERLHVGLSYDVNAGKVAQPTNSRGAFEISVTYIHPSNWREGVACPKF